MQELSTALLRRLGIRPMTEPEAFMAYTRHVRDHGCAGAGPSGWAASRVCQDGARLRETWERAQAAQRAGTQATPRPRAGVGRR